MIPNHLLKPLKELCATDLGERHQLRNHAKKKEQKCKTTLQKMFKFNIFT